MPTTLQESLDLVKQVRAENGALVAHLNDQELADLVHQQSGDERFLPAAQSNSMQRGINYVGQTFAGLGKSAENTIASPDSPYPQRLLGRVVGNAVGGLPELASGVAAASTRGLPSALLAGLGATYTYGKNKAETNNTGAALGASAGFLASLGGGVKGAQLAERAMGEGAGTIGKFAGTTAGATLGSMPGDFLGAVTQPGETLDLSKMRSDELGLPAYFAGQPFVGAALSVAHAAAGKAKLAMESTKAATPDMETIIPKSDADALAELNKVPVTDLTELQAQQKVSLARKLGAADEAALAARVKNQDGTVQDVADDGETPATITAQLNQLNRGTRAAVELPNGSTLTPNDLPDVQMHFKKHVSEDGRSFIYDADKTTPDQINNAIQTSSLGHLFGYGVGDVPKSPSGEIAVLRNQRGVEKTSVILDEQSKPAVLAALDKQSIAGDTINIETPQQVLEWRQKNKGLQKLYSIAKGEGDNPQDDVSFSNNVLDMLGNSLTPKIRGMRTKGPRFQPDVNGDINGAGVLQAIKQWAPADLFAHYQDRGIETLLAPNKVPPKFIGNQDLGNGTSMRMFNLTKPIKSASGEVLHPVNSTVSEQTLQKYGVKPGKVKLGEVVDWLRENTPEIEMKKLAPFTGPSDKIAEAQHYLENQGFRVNDTDIQPPAAYGDGLITQVTPEIRAQYGNSIGDAINSLFSEPRNAFESTNDAATGRYGVEPKELSQMPGAVDLLVRVPTMQVPELKPGRGPTGEWYTGLPAHEKPESVLFRGPHFGESDKNVLASIRGYMETLPSGEKVFHVFELQSDWGQRFNKGKEDGLYNRSGGGKETRTGTPDHPLLSHYETLGLKAAIQHALSEGATHLAISDAETAMMTEGHDRYATPEVVNNEQIPGSKVITQEPGMRAAYDQRLPAIMENLVGGKGKKADFGMNKNALLPSDRFEGTIDKNAGSPVFKNPNGSPKINITARSWDIRNPSPAVRKLFSLYDLASQTQFEGQLRREQEKLDSGQRPPEELSREQVLQRAVEGSLTKTDPLIKFLDAIKGTRGVLREESMPAGQLASVDLPSKSISLSREAKLRVNEALGKLAHEQTHIAIDELPKPVQEALKQNVSDLGLEGRRGILNELKETHGLGDTFDTSYLAGEHFDPKDPFYADKLMHEFTGGIMEAAAQAHFNNQPKGWLSYLSLSVQKLVTKVMGSLKSLFSDTSPSLSKMLSPQAGKHLNAVVDEMQRSALHSEDVNLRALLNLEKSGKFDESEFPTQISQRDSDLAPRSGPTELASFASRLYEPVRDAIKKKYENHLFSALFRARTKPETAGHFWALHNLRPNNISDDHGYRSFIGQKADNSLSRQQALERSATLFDQNIMDTGARGEKFRNAFGDINEENQNRREAAKTDLTDDQLVTTKDMQEKYGMSEEQAELAKRLIKTADLVAKESLRKGRQEDIINLTRAFYGANKKQDIEGVRAAVSRIARLTTDAGANRFQLEAYQKQLSESKSHQTPDLEAQGELGAEIQKLQMQEENYKHLLDQQVRQEFSGTIPFKPANDPFINGINEFMVKLSAIRAREQFTTGSAGWASMTRRGRFRLRVKDDSGLGAEYGKVLEYRGFQTEKELDDYVNSKGYGGSQIEKYDMNDVKKRVESYTPSGLQQVRDLAKSQLDSALAQVQSKASGLSPEMQEMLTNVITDIKASFRPVQQELADTIAIKGNKFGQRRYNVAGFNKNDFLPNLFEYMGYKTASANKALAKAESDLQISRGELDSQPELRERMKKEQDYVLSSQTEYNLAKKLIFYYYLGANFRHVLQNAVQIPLNGISQMVAEGSGLKSYQHFAEGAKMAARYNLKGTTGDRVVDILLKQAEKDGVSFSTALEGPLHTGDDLQNVLDSINATSEGKIGFGQKIGIAGTKVARGFEKFLQATSEAAESGNRKTTFVASILADRAKGVSDPRTLYDKASKFTNFVNFVGDKPNRPGYMILHGNTPIHGPLGLLTALQSFVVNHISQLYSFYEKGFHQGSVNDKKAFAVGVSHLLAFAGSMGMVGMSTAEQLLEEVTGKSMRTLYREDLVNGMTSLSDDENTKESLRHGADMIADTTMYGFPALAGIDSSDSIGLGSPFFRYQAGKPMTVEQFGGAGLGMLGRVAQGVGKIKEDPFNPQAWWSATRSAAPSFLGNAIKTYELLNSGSSLDASQQPIGEPLGVSGSISALAGFTPMETSKQRDLNDRIYKSTKKSADDYQRNVLNVSHLYSDYEQTGSPASLQRANDEFEKYIDSVGGLQDRDEMIKSIADQVQQNKGQVTKAASLKDSATRQTLESAFPSLKPHYPSQVSSALDELAIAMSLGQDDVVARTAKSLPQSLQHKSLSDLLVASGLRPEEVAQLLQPQSVGHLGR